MTTLRSPITTHVLDTSLGKPAQGISVALEYQDEFGKWLELRSGTTNNDGRIEDLLPSDYKIKAGQYRLTFFTESYFTELGKDSFYPQVAVVFVVHQSTATAMEHYHIPLLLSPFGYSTYRGT